VITALQPHLLTHASAYFHNIDKDSTASTKEPFCAMLRRRSTTRGRLQRQKTTSSVRSVQLEFLNATAAQRDAHLAASQAFNRSQDQHSTVDITLFPQPLKSLPAHSTIGTSRNSQDGAHSPADRGAYIPRRRSVRFVQPGHTHLHTRGAASCSSRSLQAMNHDAIDTATQSGMHNADRAKVLQQTENRWTSLSQVGGRQDHSQTRGFYSSDVLGLSSGDKYCTSEDDIASAPSSYRHLRRSQSMFRSLPSDDVSHEDEPSSSYFSGASPDHRRVPKSSTTSRILPQPGKENEHPSLQIPKSMSFLKSRHARGRSASSRDGTPTRVNIASSSGEPKTLPRLRAQRSTFFSSKCGKTGHFQGGMRKSLRSSSPDSAISPSTSLPAVLVTENGSLKRKVREVSRSFKIKIKSLFSRSKAEAGLANTEEISTKTEQKNALSDVEDQQAPVIRDGMTHLRRQASLQSVSSSVTAPCLVPPEIQLRSRQGSLESLPSIKTDPESVSRVTSWASSSGATVSSQQAAWMKSEEQHLAVIDDIEAHHRSPSQLHDGEVITPTRHVAVVSEHPVGAYDTQRMFCALVKRCDDRQGLLEDEHQTDTKLDGTFHVGSAKAVIAQSSLSNTDQDDSTPVTIRCVRSHSDELSCNAWLDVLDNQAMFHERNYMIPAAGTASRPPTTPRGITEGVATDSYRVLSPQMDLKPTNLIPTNFIGACERGSNLSGSPTQHLFRTGSQFRRALRENIESSKISITDLISNVGQGTQEWASPDLDSEYRSESDYSSATTRQYRIPGEATPGIKSDLGSTGNNAEGSCHLKSTSDHSIDWQTWLAANISELELPSSPARGPQTRQEGCKPRILSSLSRKHVREGAQISGDDDDQSYGSDPVNDRISLSATPEKEHSSASKPSSGQQLLQDQSIEHVASDIGATKVSTQEKIPAPPIPPRSALRPVQTSSTTNQGHLERLSQMQTSEQKAVLRRSKSLARMNRIRASQLGSPRKMAPLSAAHAASIDSTCGELMGTSAASSPGLTAAVQRQFGTTAHHDIVGSGDKENIRSTPQNSEAFRTSPDIAHKIEFDYQPVDSKQMVDLFLSSRRRRMASSEATDAFI